MLARPALDPELAAGLEGMPLVTEVTAELLPQLRAMSAVPAEAVLAGRTVRRREVEVPVQTPGADAGSGAGAESSTISMTVLTPANAKPGAPCVYWLHGGGRIMGDRFSQLDIPLEWLDEFGAVVVTIDYRLAPEATGDTAVEDCYQGLLWIKEHADELGIDADRIIIAGASAGGGLAAGVTLMARDRRTQVIAAQLLICPMLDDSNSSVSSQQYAGEPGVWTRETNAFAWNAVGQPSAYVSPARHGDLADLPTAYIDAGSAEVFRDEDVAYASRIWAAGGQAELHVWAGGFHGFDALFPDAALSVAARKTRTAWLARTLACLQVGLSS
ncbi:alpha/beta hydrolase [Kribbella endophytica]